MLIGDGRTLHNPNVSSEAKANAEEQLAAIDEGAGGKKNPSHVAGGLKA